ncbi:hypothetical protein C8Q79DRAFT_943935 [Trametes meyenii]|nr:hypothetical protein C8Q79DRAFT_943935 [Trametes meyenii]
MADPYVYRKTARQSYRPRNLMSPGLQRAREPFRLRNAITGVVLAGFAVGVWAYSIGAVKQDVFDDVDEEARAMMAGSSVPKAEDNIVESSQATHTQGTAIALPTQRSTSSSIATTARPETKSGTGTSQRGILPPLLAQRFPSLLDPSSKTLIWGAPSVDNVGKLRDPAPGNKRVI